MGAARRRAVGGSDRPCRRFIRRENRVPGERARPDRAILSDLWRGTILADIIGALLMLFAATGWLLGTFAMPAESKPHAVPRWKGICEALMAAGLAVAFYAIS